MGLVPSKYVHMYVLIENSTLRWGWIDITAPQIIVNKPKLIMIDHLPAIRPSIGCIRWEAIRNRGLFAALEHL